MRTLSLRSYGRGSYTKVRPSGPLSVSQHVAVCAVVSVHCLSLGPPAPNRATQRRQRPNAQASKATHSLPSGKHLHGHRFPGPSSLFSVKGLHQDRQ
eukprot:2468637-Amphidinium_carterae.1